MNKPGIVEVKLPVSEFVDRYLISELKMDKFAQAGKSNTEELKAWIDSHTDDYKRIVDSSDKVKSAATSLGEVHAKLWNLEDLVRSPEAKDEHYFARTAKRIFDLNTDRHKLKHAIDTELPSMSFGPRLYNKGSV